MRALTNEEAFLLAGAAGPDEVLVGPGYEGDGMTLLLRGLLAFVSGTDGELIEATPRGMLALRVHRAYLASTGATS